VIFAWFMAAPCSQLIDLSIVMTTTYVDFHHVILANWSALSDVYNKLAKDKVTLFLVGSVISAARWLGVTNLPDWSVYRRGWGCFSRGPGG
jgi:hypothetical protein